MPPKSMFILPLSRSSICVNPRPVIRRTRSWRGIMHVRFNDNAVDRKYLGMQAFVWAPLRVFGVGVAILSAFYMASGHDVFMHSLLGYESEMQYEGRVNPTLEGGTYGSHMDRDKSWKSPLRDLERPLHPRREFDVFKDLPTP